MSDLIDRQTAIDRATKEHDFFRGAVTVSDKARRDELLNVMCWLGELPPAQPNVHDLAKDADCISRRAAITALSNEIVKRRLLDEMYDGCIDEFQTEEILKKLPSAQPEIVTCDRCVATKRSECIWHNAGATYCSFGKVTE